MSLASMLYAIYVMLKDSSGCTALVHDQNARQDTWMSQCCFLGI